jgi:hypothetical protein
MFNVLLGDGSGHFSVLLRDDGYRYLMYYRIKIMDISFSYE